MQAPPHGYPVDDLFALPDLPRHTELIDGNLVVASPQTGFHSVTICLLESGLRRTVSDAFRVRSRMTIVLDPRNAPEPDVLVVRAEAVRSGEQDRYEAADVVLAIEVVSPDSEERDRDAKPRKYAAAGIRYFWLVEKKEGRRPVVHTYELDPVTKSYAITGIHHERLKLTVPFTIDIDLTEIDHM
ncbi:Uma2 family endonuclease [Streptomyces sparsogenes]|uniref:Uma2 family endonuclease n=1 Tax=Streptomyces sparsogenes TaxID=67365 RepID=UPI0033C8B84F